VTGKGFFLEIFIGKKGVGVAGFLNKLKIEQVILNYL